MSETLSERVTRDRRTIISALWAFVLLNMLFRDVHEIFRPGAIAEYQAMVVPESLFLAAGIGLTVFISMMVVTLVVPARAARIANLVAPALALAAIAGADVNDLDDAWFAAVEVVALLVIMALAWRWRP